MTTKSKKDFKFYQSIMNQKFDWEDKKVKIFNQIFNLRNENLHCCQQLRIVEDQIREFFNRKRIESEEQENEKKK